MLKSSINRGFLTLVLMSVLSLAACNIPANAAPKSTSGVTKATVAVQTDSTGLTVEQKNIQDRLKIDNAPGSIKHLYVISAYSGDVIMYSTVRGKVTSSSKRLSPTTVAVLDGQYVDSSHQGFNVDFGGDSKRTGEVLQDDGTYGSSDPYIYWLDEKGVYHQHYVTGGQIIHVSTAPLRVNKVLINLAN